MTLKQDNPLSGEVETKLDGILAWLLNTTPDKLGTRARHDGYVLAKSKLTKLLLEQRIEAQTNAVAWTIGVIDDVHGINGRIDSDGRLDRTFKGVKNAIRDRYKAEVGFDPAPNYPVHAQLNQLDKEES